MKEFGYYKSNNEPVVLNDHIFICDNDNKDEFLVANSPKLNANIIAPEIDFYIKNSKDGTINKAKNVSLLYEARAICFDLAKDMDYTKKVGKNIIIISNETRTELESLLKNNDFKVACFNHFDIKFIYGAVGELSVIIANNTDEFEVECDFVLVENAREYMLRQSGCIEISKKQDNEILDFLLSSSPNYLYKNFINYDSSICQYHERRHEICGRCADICPTVAILKEDETKHLVFSHVDCINCGKCISVCPSGSLDYSIMPRIAFFEVARMYKDKIPLIISKKIDISNLEIEIPPNIVPFAIESEGFLNEAHLITLLQESGSNVIFYTDSLSSGTNAAIDILNKAYYLKYKKHAIFVSRNKDELNDAFSCVGAIEGSHFSISEHSLLKREIFAKRLEYLVGNEDLGVIYTDENIRYGSISINRDTCTLCLSCVGACNVNALIADAKDNSIKFNPSICTNCGYCEVSCAEKDTLFLYPKKLELKPSFFTYNELAKDELFKCRECGKEFATKKAIEKIASIMEPRFVGFPEKIYTLYCCSECKAKVMIKKQLEAMKEGGYMYE